MAWLRFLVLTVCIGCGLAAPAAVRAENADGVAIIIGNQNYATPIPRVDFADNDAAAMKRFVIDTLGYRDGNVIVLANATQSVLNAWFGADGRPKGKLHNIIREGRSDVVVYYSGHGVPGLSDKRGYLLPVDGDPSVIEQTGYSLDTLFANLAALDARSVTVYIDACFSGGSAKGTLITAASGLAVVPVMPKASAKMVVLTAASGDQVASWDAKDRQGLFTHFLLAALEGQAADPAKGGERKVTLGAVKAYLDDQMTYEARRQYNREQTATASGPDATVLAVLPPKDATAPTPAPASASATPAADAELLFWQTIANSGNPADFQAYLDQYPQGRFAALARIRAKTQQAAEPVAPAPQPEQKTAMVTPPSPARPASGTPIVIGVAGPMTGELAQYGEQIKRGVEQAVADLNAQGGVLGRRIATTMGDDACDPKRAVAVANDFVRQGIKFVVGHFCSGSSIPASAVYADANVIQITPSSSNPTLTEDAASHGWQHVFRTTGRDDMQGAFGARYIVDRFAGQRIAIVDDNTVYGNVVARMAERTLQSLGVRPAVVDKVAAGQKDFSALVDKLKSAGAEVVYFGGYHVEAALLIRQAWEHGYKPQLFSDDALGSDEFWRVAGPAGEGTLMTFEPDAKEGPDARAVVAAFTRVSYDPGFYTMTAYAAVQVWARAVESVGGWDNARIEAAIHGHAFDTVVGKLAFDGKGDIIDSGFAIDRWHDGHYAEIR